MHVFLCKKRKRAVRRIMYTHLTTALFLCFAFLFITRFNPFLEKYLLFSYLVLFFSNAPPKSIDEDNTIAANGTDAVATSPV